MTLKTAIRSALSGEGGIELSKYQHPRSLSTQLLLGALLSLLAAVLSFGLFYLIGNTCLDHTVYGNKFSEKMSERQFRRLQDYVTQENIASGNLNRLNAWCGREKGIYLTLYSDGKLIYKSAASRETAIEPEAFNPQSEDAQQEFTLSLSDGIKVKAFLYYFAGDAFYFWMIGVSGLLSFVVFSLCFITLIHRKLTYIERLKKELDILAGGDLTYAVTVRGQDELSELALGIDEMRRSILAHQESENTIRSANSQLVTAMSHDLRTPLTSLMAYLELLDRDKVKDEEQRRHLIRQSLSQTISIKAMADKLFEYFLVYTTEWEQPEPEIVSADEIMGHFWQEYAFSLENHGFTVKTDFGELNGTLKINMELLRRAFDNLFANIVKYAEPSEPVLIRYCRESGQLVLTLKNAVISGQDRIESTNIGLNTCRRILKIHNGSFETKELNGSFSAELRLPLLPKAKNK